MTRISNRIKAHKVSVQRRNLISLPRDEMDPIVKTQFLRF